MLGAAYNKEQDVIETEHTKRRRYHKTNFPINPTRIQKQSTPFSLSCLKLKSPQPSFSMHSLNGSVLPKGAWPCAELDWARVM